jgi:hypothetical protein
MIVAMPSVPRFSTKRLGRPDLPPHFPRVGNWAIRVSVSQNAASHKVRAVGRVAVCGSDGVGRGRDWINRVGLTARRSLPGLARLADILRVIGHVTKVPVPGANIRCANIRYGSWDTQVEFHVWSIRPSVALFRHPAMLDADSNWG